MTTLIIWHGPGGTELGRCDAKCHNAWTAPERCDCLCGGQNHGAGRQRAIDQTRDQADTWTAQARTRGYQVTGYTLDPQAAHEPLFTLPGGGDR